MPLAELWKTFTTLISSCFIVYKNIFNYANWVYNKTGKIVGYNVKLLETTQQREKIIGFFIDAFNFNLLLINI